MKVIISLGAGIQSSAMALMSADGAWGVIPECAIFADTGWEPPKVYEWLTYLETKLPFPVYRVHGRNIREDLMNHRSHSGERFSTVPFFLKNPDGSAGMGIRQCTFDYKIRPIQKKTVELVGHKKAGGTELWIGISTDEGSRMKPSRVKYIVHRFPLIESWLSRKDCEKYIRDKLGRTPPKSACIGCPFHSNSMWREMKLHDPDSWADAVEVDKAIRVKHGMRLEQFMHPSLVPLEQVDLSTAEDRGQLNLFENECEGMCGL